MQTSSFFSGADDEGEVGFDAGGTGAESVAVVVVVVVVVLVNKKEPLS